jgi:hypothetical protein
LGTEKVIHQEMPKNANNPGASGTTSEGKTMSNKEGITHPDALVHS